MEVGQVINGYLVLGVDNMAFSTKGAGLSIWTFASKNGIQYFMKEFLSPNYPLDDGPGGLAFKNKKRKECSDFEEYHSKIKNIIYPHKDKSNLVYTVDFFKYGTKYYKVTQKIAACNLDIASISGLALEKKIGIVKTLSNCLKTLHDVGLVHSDLKLDNNIVGEEYNSIYSSHLIDYDNCYTSRYPPTERNKMIGDLLYYSPEFERYINNADFEGSNLTTKSDIFSLGLMFCKYLTGEFPSGISEGKYASNAVNNGSLITINPFLGLPSSIVNVVNKMLLKNSAERPNIDEIIDVLNRVSGNNIIQKGRVLINLGNKR